MQTHNRSSRLLLPARQSFVVASLLVALVLNLVPLGMAPLLPDWVALTLAFWNVREPRRSGMLPGFVLGLFMDVAHGAVLGQHPLAYVVVAFGAQALSRRVLWFSHWEQALHVLPLLLLAQALMVVVRLAAGAHFPGWGYFASSFSGALIWPALSMLLLWPQARPVEKDENRPL